MTAHYYLFAYYEYTGNDYKADMETLAKEPRNIKWLSMTDAMQIPLPGADRGPRCRRSFTTRKRWAAQDFLLSRERASRMWSRIAVRAASASRARIAA